MKKIERIINIKITLTLIGCIFFASHLFCQNESDPNNVFNTLGDLIGMDKSFIMEAHNKAKHPLLADNNVETVYLVTNGVYEIYHFDKKNKVEQVIIKLTRENHFIVAQLLLKDSDWEYVSGDDIGRTYKNNKYPSLAGALIKEQEPGYADATYFIVGHPQN